MVKKAISMHETYVNSDDYYLALRKERDRMYNEVRMKEAIDKGLEEGLQKGIQQGLQQGLEQGLQQGLQEGKLQGKQQAMLEVAKGLKEKNVDIETIISVTHLTKEDISEI